MKNRLPSVPNDGTHIICHGEGRHNESVRAFEADLFPNLLR